MCLDGALVSSYLAGNSNHAADCWYHKVAVKQPYLLDQSVISNLEKLMQALKLVP